ncbi:MAG: amidohydrolase family protein [Methylococcaceae bacterium]|jgi:hypothetical protein
MLKFLLFKLLGLASLASLLSCCQIAFAGQESQPIVLQAKQVFDGHHYRNDTAVLVVNGLVAEIAPRAAIHSSNAKVIDLGDATLLPGFIELHAHSQFQHVPTDVVLKHGVTTLRDVGGRVFHATGGDGKLRMLTSGPIITAPGGYPIPNLGVNEIALPVSTEQQARETVRQLVAGGAVIIKVALEPGGEIGAPWSQHHSHQTLAHKTAMPHKPWPLLPQAIVKAIVDEASRHQRNVTAHIGDKKGALLALNAGITEWAHMPCELIPKAVLKRAFAQQVNIVSTLDTLSKCPGISANAKHWSALGGVLLYGAEIAHLDIPWGIDAQELIDMMGKAHMTLEDVLRSATSKAGSYLNIPLLGTLAAGAPADIIAVKGSLEPSLKKLEYPNFVMSGGKIVLNDFAD